MTWLLVPSITSASAPGLADSTWPLASRCRLLAASATSKGKQAPWQSWLRGCKTNPSIRLLSGLISEPSTAALGVESWISSLRASRARGTPSPESVNSNATSETCGRTSGECFGRWDADSSFWRTFSPPPCPTPTCGHTACESAALARIAASWRRGWLPPPGLRNRRKKHGLRPFRSPGLRKRRLNAAFVAWLMGWPAGWTSFGRAETESFRSRAGRHLSSLLTSWGFSVTLG